MREMTGVSFGLRLREMRLGVKAEYRKVEYDGTSVFVRGFSRNDFNKIFHEALENQYFIKLLFLFNNTREGY